MTKYNSENIDKGENLESTGLIDKRLHNTQERSKPRSISPRDV